MPHSAINHQALTVRLGDTPEWPSALPWQPPHFSNTLPIMSQTSENNQSSSYYPPAQFPSPSMAGQYSYPPPEGQGNSPSGANMTLPPALSLPPIHTIDGRPQPQQQQQGQGQGQQGAQNQMPPAMGQYYGQGQPFPPTSDPSQPMRYPIPPDGRVMSGGRHKKEIKRRTKTGCLTCRKRRIKCDEAHPACRNCQKSKRECMGYDPIFKSQPGPTNIQPALSGASSMQSTSANSSPYPQPTHGYMHTGSQGYGQPGTDSEHSTTQPFDYSAAIDPALEGAGSSDMQNDVKGALGTGTPYPLPTSEQHNHRAKRTKIEELLCLRGISPPPPAPPSSIPLSMRDEIKSVWMTVYSVGIDKFLETRWFCQRGLTHLLENNRLCDQFASLIRRYSPNPQDPNVVHTMMLTQSLEATIVWAMMGMCRQVANSEKVAEEDVKEGVHDAAKRLEIFENLITGEYLDSDSAPPKTKSNGTAFDNQLQTREHDFWRLVHKFLTIRDDEASAAKEIDETLVAARNLLDSRENRDVIYSIMIARHVGARMAEFPENLPQPQSNDEEDSKHKLIIAKKFIEEEATAKGTTQVVQRLCGMACRSWEISIIKR